MPEIKHIRIDKYLWSVRIYKTRSIASEACRKGRILVNGIQAKPSKVVAAGEIISVKKPPAVLTYRIIEPVEKRVSAKLASTFVEDITPEAEKERLLMKLSASATYREKGTGRPTKKERRDIDRMIEDFNEW